MNINSFRRNWLKLQKSYEYQAYKIIQRAFSNMANDINFNSMTPTTYEMYVETSVSTEAMQAAYIELYSTIGIAHGKRMGRIINKDTKNFVADLFIEEYRTNLINWIINNAGSRIVSVRATYVDYIKGIIEQGVKDGKTIVQIAKEIQVMIKKPNFYRWQALRIARTETTAAANRGAVQAGENSRLVYEKVWVSGDDARVRTRPKSQYDHREMNGKRVDKDQPFNVNGELIMYAGAPQTVSGAPSHGQNIINCRCANLIVVKKDSNGRPIRR